MASDYTTQVAEKIIEKLKQGTAPWQKPWKAGERFLPYNPTSGNNYRGINSMWLSIQGYDDSRWMTYRQAAGIGAQVSKGEKGTLVEYWQWNGSEKIKDDQGRPVLDSEGKQMTRTVEYSRPRVMRAVAFNAQQIDGLPAPEPRDLPSEWERHERADQILSRSPAPIQHVRGDRAYYEPLRDRITLPDRDQFETGDRYYATALHEIGHSTGHESRLNRDLAHAFGSEGYAREELVAEIASLMIGDELGIGHDPGQHVAYVGSWIKRLEENPREIFQAAAEAEKVSRFVMGLEKEQEVERTEPAPIIEQIQSLVGKGLPMNDPQDLTGPTMEHMIVAIMDTLGDREQSVEALSLTMQLRAVSLDYQRFHLDPDDAKELSAKAKADPQLARVNAQFLEFEARSQRHANAAMFMLAAAIPEDLNQTEVGPVPIALSLHTRDADDLFSEVREWFTEDDRLARHDSVLVALMPAAVERAEATLLAHHKALQPEPRLTAERVDLTVPFSEKNEAKALGAKWDKEGKTWYAPAGTNLEPLSKWTGQDQAVSLPETPEEEFRQALEAYGLIIEGLPVMDGTLQRVPTNDDRRSGSGAYQEKSGAYTGYLDGHPAGFIQNHRTGVRENWKSQQKTVGLSTADRLRLEAESQARRAEREAAQQAGYENAAQGVAVILTTTTPAEAHHRYLKAKDLPPSGVQTMTSAHAMPPGDPEPQRFGGEGHIAVPAHDIDGKVWTVQGIAPDGRKSFPKGTRLQGCHHLIGDVGQDGPILFAEGYATAKELHDKTNLPTVACFNANNLEAVARDYRSRFPDRALVIAGDNDHARETEIDPATNEPKPNVGKTKAVAAAQAVDGYAMLPAFQLGDKGSDWNDLRKVRGADEQMQQLRAGLAIAVRRERTAEVTRARSTEREGPDEDLRREHRQEVRQERAGERPDREPARAGRSTDDDRDDRERIPARAAGLGR